MELSDGSRKRSGQQAKDENGVPVWTVDVVVDDDESDRAEAVGVTIASWEPPVTQKWQPVKFTNLMAGIYRDKISGQPKVSLKADGIENAQAKPSAAA